jgi:hypothetical protein
VTVTVTGALVVWFPIVSLARAASVCGPFGAADVSQDTEYGATVLSVPSGLPSSKNCTPATATLSVAVACTVSDPEMVAPFAGLVTFTVGGVVSGAAFDVVIFTPTLVVSFPPTSRARADNVCEPFAVEALFQEMEYGAVVSSLPMGDPSSRNCTPAIPRLSLAVADTVTAPVTVAPFAGAVIETVGGVASPSGVFMSLTISAGVEARLKTLTSSMSPAKNSVHTAVPPMRSAPVDVVMFPLTDRELTSTPLT